MNEASFGINKKLRSMTIPELLVVMIVSGIVFLLIFDGLSIIQRYGYLLDRKLTANSGLLYSHQVLGTVLDKTDSIHWSENTLLLYISNDPVIHHLELDSSCILFRREEYTDTLFAGLTDIVLHPISPGSLWVDSLHLFIPIGKDTVILDYGIPPRVEWTLKEPIQ